MYISVETISWRAIEMNWMNENKNGFYFWFDKKFVHRFPRQHHTSIKSKYF